MNAQQHTIELDIEMGTPGMTVGARRFGIFCPGGEPDGKLVSPGLQGIEQAVGHADLIHGLLYEIAEIESGLDECSIIKHLAAHLLRFVFFKHLSQYGQGIDVL